MIIVEGPDGSGKTTLVRDLSRDLNMLVAPRVVAQDTTAMVDLKQWVDHNLDRGFQPVIFDRHRLISEPIYGTIMPGKRENSGFWADFEWLAESMRRFYDIQPFIVVCLPPYDVVMNNLLDDPSNREVFPHTWAIYRAYQAFAASGLSGHGVDCVYNYASGGDRQLFMRMLESRILHRMHNRRR